MKKIVVVLVWSLWLFGATNAFAVNPVMLTAKGNAAGEAQTDESVALPENLRAEDIDALMARLNDEQVRRLLIAEL